MAAAIEARDERLRLDDAAQEVAAAPAAFTVAGALTDCYARGLRNRKWKPSTEYGYGRYLEADLNQDWCLKCPSAPPNAPILVSAPREE